MIRLALATAALLASTSLTLAAGTTATFKPIIGGLQREYVFHTPPTSCSGLLPLMLMYHGEGGTGPEFESQTKMDAVADAGCFEVAYPSSYNGGSWMLSGIPTNDIDFTAYIIAHTPNDPVRIYAAGHSAGGGMVEALVCDGSNKIAAFANISEDLSFGMERQCTAPLAAPAFVSHGTVDPISPYNGDANSNSAQNTAAYWANIDKAYGITVSSIPLILTNGARAIGNISTWGAAPGTVVFYSLTGAGHGWPGASYPKSKLNQIGPNVTNLNYSQIIWQFMSRFTR